MKKILVLMMIVSSFQAFASDEKSKPCMEVKKACEAAGFSKGKHKEGKGLHIDCVQKLANGEAVAGVTISQDVIAACKAKKAEHAEKKEKK